MKKRRVSAKKTFRRLLRTPTYVRTHDDSVPFSHVGNSVLSQTIFKNLYPKNGNKIFARTRKKKCLLICLIMPYSILIRFSFIANFIGISLSSGHKCILESNKELKTVELVSMSYSLTNIKIHK